MKRLFSFMVSFLVLLSLPPKSVASPQLAAGSEPPRASSKLQSTQPSPSPPPFWKAKPEVYRRMKEDRYIALSARTETVGDEKKLTVVSAGVIHAPEAFVHSTITRFSDYSKYVPYIEESTYDDTTYNLFIHGAVLGYHVRMTLHTKVEEKGPGEHVVFWESVGGGFVGMKGSINEVNLDPDHTEISMNGFYTAKSLGLPAIILNWGLEFAIQRASGSMRSHIESEWENSKKH